MNNSLLRTNQEFVDIYNRNFDNVYHMCYLILKNTHDAEDITQSVFLKIYNKNIIFNDINHEKGYLLLMAKHMSLNSIKHWKSRITSLINNDYESISDSKDDTLESLLNLKEKYKLVIYLHYYMGYKTNEISNMLNMKESTVRSNLLRGRKMLKDILEDKNEK